MLKCATIWVVFYFFYMQKLSKFMAFILLISVPILLNGCEGDNASLSEAGSLNQQKEDVPAQNDSEVFETAGDSVDENEAIIETDLGKVKIDEKTGNGYLEMEKSTEIIVDSDNVSERMPKDMPTLENGKNFNWAGVDGSGMLSYRFAGESYKKVCDDQIGLLEGKGWVMDEGVAVQFSGTSTHTLNKEGYILSLTCTENSDDPDDVTVTIVKGAN